MSPRCLLECVDLRVGLTAANIVDARVCGFACAGPFSEAITEEMLRALRDGALSAEKQPYHEIDYLLRISLAAR